MEDEKSAVDERKEIVDILIEYPSDIHNFIERWRSKILDEAKYFSEARLNLSVPKDYDLSIEIPSRVEAIHKLLSELQDIHNKKIIQLKLLAESVKENG